MLLHSSPAWLCSSHSQQPAQGALKEAACPKDPLFSLHRSLMTALFLELCSHQRPKSLEPARGEGGRGQHVVPGSVGGCGEVWWLGWRLACRHKGPCGRLEGWDVTERTTVEKQSNPGSCAAAHGVAGQAKQDSYPQAVIGGQCTRGTQ